MLTSSGHLEAGDRLEVHHLQHLLGLSVNLDDILERNTLDSEGSTQVIVQVQEDIKCKPASKHAHHMKV